VSGKKGFGVTFTFSNCHIIGLDTVGHLYYKKAKQKILQATAVIVICYCWKMHSASKHIAFMLQKSYSSAGQYVKNSSDNSFQMNPTIELYMAYGQVQCVVHL
jgi:hypothetical protein